MLYEKQTGLTANPAEIAMVKLVPATRAEITGGAARNPVLQVTPNFAPKLWSTCTIIWLFAVTAVVFTTTEVPAAAITTDPAAAEPQTAGEAALEQFIVVM